MIGKQATNFLTNSGVFRYLTPTAKDGTEYLKAVQRAIAGDASTIGQPKMLKRVGEHK